MTRPTASPDAANRLDMVPADCYAMMGSMQAAGMASGKAKVAEGSTGGQTATGPNAASRMRQGDNPSTRRKSGGTSSGEC